MTSATSTRAKAAGLRAAASVVLLWACGTAAVLAQSRHEPSAARIEQAAIEFVRLLDAGRYDEAAAKLRADAARLGPLGAAPIDGVGAAPTGPVRGVPGATDVRRALDTRRERGSLMNRETMTVFVEPLVTQVTSGRPPGQQPRGFRVDFDTDPEVPMLDRRRHPAPHYRESVGGYLLPDGEVLVVAYSGEALHSSDRVTGATPAPGSGTTAPEAVAIELALGVARLLDDGRVAEVLEQIRSGSPEHYTDGPNWEPVAQRLRDDVAKRARRGALSDRKVMLAARESGQGRYSITLGATGERAPVPPRYGPNPLGSTETIRVQVFGGEARVLDYRFGY